MPDEKQSRPVLGYRRPETSMPKMYNSRGECSVSKFHRINADIKACRRAFIACDVVIVGLDAEALLLLQLHHSPMIALFLRRAFFYSGHRTEDFAFSTLMREVQLQLKISSVLAGATFGGGSK